MSAFNQSGQIVTGLQFNIGGEVRTNSRKEKAARAFFSRLDTEELYKIMENEMALHWNEETQEWTN